MTQPLLECDDEVYPRDVVLSVIMAIMALMLTAPPTVLLVREWFYFRFSLGVLLPFLMISLWNGYIFGYPVLVLTRRWHHRIRHDQFGYDWIWGHYWRLQLHALAPLLIIAIFLLLIVIGFWLSTFLPR